MLETPAIYVDAIRMEVLMRGKGFTMTGLARAMDCNISNLHRIKSSGRTTLQTLETMCVVLECHPFDLLVARGFPAIRLPRSGESLFLNSGDW